MILIYFFTGLYFVSMLFIFLYSLSQAHLLYHFVLYQKNPPPLETNILKDLPIVTVQLPIYNERYVVERLINAVADLNYPIEKLEIQLLDDSTDETQQLILEKIKEFPKHNFHYLHRLDRRGFK